jgi:hypothetical protein
VFKVGGVLGSRPYFPRLDFPKFPAERKELPLDYRNLPRTRNDRMK